MIGYASHTGTRRNIEALRAHGWRLLISASALKRNTFGLRYSLDNGAWAAHLAGRPFDAAAFERALDAVGVDADFIVAPDIVGGGYRSLDLSCSWLPRLSSARLVLVPVQDGMDEDNVIGLLGPRIGIFVGGTTEWKLATAIAWGEISNVAGCYLHIGRVNTARRLGVCAAAGADSFDGTSATMYATTLPALDAARRRRDMFTVKGKP